MKATRVPGKAPADRVPRAPAAEEELEKKKIDLENKGKDMAREAGHGVKFAKLEEGWQVECSTPVYWFKDPKGYQIKARDLEELKWKVGRLYPEPHSPTVILPRLPQEAYRDIFFMEYIRDFAKLSREPISDEEARRMWEAWKRKEGGSRKGEVESGR